MSSVALHQRNAELKSRLRELEQDLENAQMNVSLLRDSLDLQTLPLSPVVDARLLEMDVRLKQARIAALSTVFHGCQWMSCT